MKEGTLWLHQTFVGDFCSSPYPGRGGYTHSLAHLAWPWTKLGYLRYKRVSHHQRGFGRRYTAEILPSFVVPSETCILSMPPGTVTRTTGSVHNNRRVANEKKVESKNGSSYDTSICRRTPMWDLLARLTDTTVLQLPTAIVSVL